MRMNLRIIKFNETKDKLFFLLLSTQVVLKSRFSLLKNILRVYKKCENAKDKLN